MQHTNPDVGVLVGRFQVHDLHEGHRELIQHVLDAHSKVIIFLGMSPLPVSANNPLDYEARRQMIQAEFPDVNVVYIPDHPSDAAWSKNLDKQIAHLVAPGQSVMLYGGRDSFIDHYSGKHPTQELLQDKFLSGTEVRKEIARSSARATADFRAGVIWASLGRFPTAFQAVDVAVLKYDSLDERPPPSSSWRGCLACQPRTACDLHKDEAAAYFAPEQPVKILLGRKSTDKLFRFPGGFSDPDSDSLEADARREVAEEMGVSIESVRYVGSKRVEDWRYRDEPDCIKTALFVATYTHGRPTPSDDMDAEVRWFDLDALTDKDIVPQHRPLFVMLTEYLQKGV